MQRHLVAAGTPRLAVMRGPRSAVVSFNEEGRRPPVVFFHTWGNEARPFAGPRRHSSGPINPCTASSRRPRSRGRCPSAWTTGSHTTGPSSTPCRSIRPTTWPASRSRRGRRSGDGPSAARRRGGGRVAGAGRRDATETQPEGWPLRPYVRYHLHEFRAAGQGNAAGRIRSARAAARTERRSESRSRPTASCLGFTSWRLGPRPSARQKGMSPLKRSVIRSYLGYRDRGRR